MTRSELWEAAKHARGRSNSVLEIWPAIDGNGWCADYYGECEDGDEPRGQGATPEAAIAAALGVEWEEPQQRLLAREQPCGCIVCYCDGDKCTGCGAKNCGTHPVGEIPNPVYVDDAEPERAPDALTLAEAVAEIERRFAMARAYTAEHQDDATSLAIGAALETVLSILRRVDAGEDSNASLLCKLSSARDACYMAYCADPRNEQIKLAWSLVLGCLDVAESMRRPVDAGEDTRLLDALEASETWMEFHMCPAAHDVQMDGGDLRAALRALNEAPE